MRKRWLANNKRHFNIINIAINFKWWLYRTSVPSVFKQRGIFYLYL